tara:strand:+ start:2187 stop:3020 length:834 start_codon:yes stop_codon:yes gene_type:complete
MFSIVFSDPFTKETVVLPADEKVPFQSNDAANNVSATWKDVFDLLSSLKKDVLTSEVFYVERKRYVLKWSEAHNSVVQISVEDRTLRTVDLRVDPPEKKQKVGPCSTVDLCATCLVDAAANGMKEFGYELSLERLRTLAVPKLGVAVQASWDSLRRALSTMGCPFKISEVTDEFNALGGTTLNVLKAPSGCIFLVALMVKQGIMTHDHCVMLSTFSFSHGDKSYVGKLIDNQVLYLLEPMDYEHKPAAEHAFKKLLSGKLYGEFSVQVTHVYELCRV